MYACACACACVHASNREGEGREKEIHVGRRLQEAEGLRLVRELRRETRENVILESR